MPVALALLLAFARAADPAPVRVVEWKAASSCPAVDALHAGIRRSLGGLAVERRTPVEVGVIVAREAAQRFRLELRLDAGDGPTERVLTTESCAAAIDTAAWLIAIAIDVRAADPAAPPSPAPPNPAPPTGIAPPNQAPPHTAPPNPAPPNTAPPNPTPPNSAPPSSPPPNSAPPTGPADKPANTAPSGVPAPTNAPPSGSPRPAKTPPSVPPAPASTAPSGPAAPANATPGPPAPATTPAPQALVVPPPLLAPGPAPLSPGQAQPPASARADAPPSANSRTPSRNSALHLDLWAGGGLGLGLLPRVAPTAALGLTLAGRRWEAELSGHYWALQRTTYEGGLGGRFVHGHAAARGCGAWERGRVRVPVCAGLAVGGLTGEGTGDLTPQVARSLWLGLLAGAGVRVALHPRIGLLLRAEAVLGLRRPGFVLEPARGLVFRPDIPGFSAFLALAVRLR